MFFLLYKSFLPIICSLFCKLQTGRPDEKVTRSSLDKDPRFLRLTL